MRRILLVVSIDEDLRDAFVDAFAPYVRRRIGEVVDESIWSDELATAVEEGRAWLARELTALVAVDPREQRQSPLALFQAALSFPTAALEAAGVAAASRDEAAAQALPGDIYDLAPASSRELGDTAWKAHVAWGIRKAEAVAGMVPVPAEPGTTPTVGVVSTDLMDRSKIEPAVKAAGLRFVVWRNPAAVAAGLAEGRPAVVFVDLVHPAADDIIRALAEDGVSIVAYGPHVDDFAMARAAALGAGTVLARSRFFAKLSDLIPKVL